MASYSTKGLALGAKLVEITKEIRSKQTDRLADKTRKEKGSYRGKNLENITSA